MQRFREWFWTVRGQTIVALALAGIVAVAAVTLWIFTGEFPAILAALALILVFLWRSYMKALRAAAPDNPDELVRVGGTLRFREYPKFVQALFIGVALVIAIAGLMQLR